MKNSLTLFDQSRFISTSETEDRPDARFYHSGPLRASRLLDDTHIFSVWVSAAVREGRVRITLQYSDSVDAVYELSPGVPLMVESRVGDPGLAVTGILLEPLTTDPELVISVFDGTRAVVGPVFSGPWLLLDESGMSAGSWVDTRQGAAITLPFTSGGTPPVLNSSDPDFNGQSSFEFEGGSDPLLYTGALADFDPVLAGDFTIACVWRYEINDTEAGEMMFESVDSPSFPGPGWRVTRDHAGDSAERFQDFIDLTGYVVARGTESNQFSIISIATFDLSSTSMRLEGEGQNNTGSGAGVLGSLATTVLPRVTGQFGRVVACYIWLETLSEQDKQAFRSFAESKWGVPSVGPYTNNAIGALSYMKNVPGISPSRQNKIRHAQVNLDDTTLPSDGNTNFIESVSGLSRADIIISGGGTVIDYELQATEADAANVVGGQESYDKGAGEVIVVDILEAYRQQGNWNGAADLSVALEGAKYDPLVPNEYVTNTPSGRPLVRFQGGVDQVQDSAPERSLPFLELPVTGESLLGHSNSVAAMCVRLDELDNQYILSNQAIAPANGFDEGFSLWLSDDATPQLEVKAQNRGGTVVYKASLGAAPIGSIITIVVVVRANNQTAELYVSGYPVITVPFTNLPVQFPSNLLRFGGAHADVYETIRSESFKGDAFEVVIHGSQSWTVAQVNEYFEWCEARYGSLNYLT